MKSFTNKQNIQMSHNENSSVNDFKNQNNEIGLKQVGGRFNTLNLHKILNLRIIKYECRR